MKLTTIQCGWIILKILHKNKNKKDKCNQSAHFSGRQNTLHNTIIQALENDEKKFVYHLSDDTNHNSVMTFCIIMDIIKNYPEVI